MKSLHAKVCFISFLYIALFTSCSGNEEVTHVLSVHTAGPNIAAVTITSGFSDTPAGHTPLDTGLDDWVVEGAIVESVHHAAWVSDALPKSGRNTYPMEITYRVYLELESPFKHGRTYDITGPFGCISFVFNDRKTFCESIKVNQVGYHPESNVRYANLGVFLGSGGSRYYSDPIFYSVLSQTDNREVYRGTAAYLGKDNKEAVSSGEHVYRLDLHEVPAGGPYIVSVDGWGRSYPFDITHEAISHIAYTYTRGLYHQRCGIALEAPWTDYTREACHLHAACTRTTWSASGGMAHDEDAPLINVTGGHHDAGDFSRRPYHTLIPIMLLGYYEAFPDHFTDGQFNLPESGNGLPDILDEALWAIRLWEHLQILDPMDQSYGGVLAGTDSPAHPIYGEVSAASDPAAIGTWDVMPDVTAFASGMMAHAARLLIDFDHGEKTAKRLYERALKAWYYLESRIDETGLAYTQSVTTDMLYASLQLYLASRSFNDDEDDQLSYYSIFSNLADQILVQDGSWPHQYRPGNMHASCHTVHFISYLISEGQRDDSLAEDIHNIITAQAHAGGYMGFSMDHSFYPHGATRAYGWGAATAQGRYADVIAFAYRLAESGDRKQQYFDILSQFGDYALGLNPLGISYVTGLGSRQVNSPLHLDSYFTKFGTSDGLHDDHLGSPKGNVPGLLVFGPTEGRSGAGYQRAVSDILYPRWDDLPLQRRWSDGWPLINSNEFSIWETMIWNICLYGVLNRPH